MTIIEINFTGWAFKHLSIEYVRNLLSEVKTRLGLHGSQS